MRIWIDATGSSRLLFFAPIMRRLEDRGHVVSLTARRIAPTRALLEKYGLSALVGGPLAAGEGPAARVVGLANRTAQLVASARQGRFDVVVGSAAGDLALAAWTLHIPLFALLDDDRLRASHALDVRLIDEIAVPDTTPLARLRALGAQPERLFRFPGYREEYYLYDFEPDDTVLDDLAIDRRRVLGVMRPPSGRALGEHGGVASLALGRLLAELCARPHVTLVVIARSDEQRDHLLGLGLKNLVVAPEPVDSLSLIAAADFVIANAGVMCREAAALGTPAYILPAEPAPHTAVGADGSPRAAASAATAARTEPPASAGAVASARRTASRTATRLQLPPGPDEAGGQPLNSVDRRLLEEGRLRVARTAADVTIRKKDERAPKGAPRDPQLFVDEILALARRRPRRSRLGRLL
jgi:predicted glycosyltransferase